MKTFFRLFFFLLLLVLAALAGYFFLETSSQTRQLLSFVPGDFVYAIESDRPVGDWQDLSQSEVWQYLKENESLAEITDMADYLDSLLTANETLVSAVSLGDMVISAHMVSPEDYEFLILVDLLGKGRKLAKLKPVMVELFKSLEYEVRTGSYFNIDLYHLTDPADGETLSLAVIDNVLMASYREDLLKQAIEQSEKPGVVAEPGFAAVRDKTDRDKLYTLYLNYARFDQLLGIYADEVPEMIQGLGEVVSHSAFDLTLNDEEAIFDGYTQQRDSAASFLRVMMEVGEGEVHAHEVLPMETAMFTSMGFDDFTDFYQRFDAYYQGSDPEGYETLQKSRKVLEKRLKIEFERDFFSWMTDEIVTAVIPLDGSGNQYGYYALLHFDDYDLAKERLDYVAGRIGKTPVKFEEIDYRGFPIKYLKLRGFFTLFFKKMFSKIEHPHFTYIDDYVIFSNDTTSLQVVIDRYLDGRVLARDEAFEDFQDEFQRKSNLFTFLQNRYLYEYLSSLLDYEAKGDLAENKPYFLSFPRIGLQMYPDGGLYKSYIYGEFEPQIKPGMRVR